MIELRIDKKNVIYLIKRTVPVEISKTITIPKATEIEDDDEMTFLCCIDDNKRDEQ
jgi:hypothetical protein